MVMSGVVLSVDVVVAGVDVLEPAAVGDLSVVGVDAFDLPTSGGVVELPDGSVVDYVSADHDEDVVTFAAPLLVALEEGDRLFARPRSSYTQAVVEVEGEGGTVPVRVPHSMQSSMPVGVRDEVSARESVTVEVRDDGSFWIYDVLDRPPLEVWGDPLGVAAEMSDDGLAFYGVGPSGRYEATRLGSGKDRLVVNNADGQIVGGVTADGAIVGQSAVFAGDVSVGGTPLMGRLWDNSPGAPVGWFERFAAGFVVNAPFTEQSGEIAAGEETGYAKVGFSARAGRAYMVRVEQRIITGADSISTRFRYTEDGTEPTVASPEMGLPLYLGVVENSLQVTLERVYVSGVDTQVNVLVTNFSMFDPYGVWDASFTVQDLGPQGSYGGGTYSTGREVTPPPTVREYTSTWTATGFRVYDESGQPVTSETRPAQFGFVGGARRYTALLFDGPAAHGEHAGDTITAATSDATLTKAEVFLANTSNGGLDAGLIHYGKGNYTSLPPTLSPQAAVTPTSPTGAGTWTEVPVSWFTGANRVITLGDANAAVGVTAAWFMGPTDDFPPQARLTYTR